MIICSPLNFHQCKYVFFSFTTDRMEIVFPSSVKYSFFHFTCFNTQYYCSILLTSPGHFSYETEAYVLLFQKLIEFEAKKVMIALRALICYFMFWKVFTSNRCTSAENEVSLPPISPLLICVTSVNCSIGSVIGPRSFRMCCSHLLFDWAWWPCTGFRFIVFDSLGKNTAWICRLITGYFSMM